MGRKREKPAGAAQPPAPPHDLTSLDSAVRAFWSVYYNQMRARHLDSGLDIHTPLKDRNLSTTASKHVHVLERFWQKQLATALGVPEEEVGKRTVKFKPYRGKSFDVCWPLKGPPKILISIKSMQNAYRNLTNRIEEAFGDSAVLRIYDSNAPFGFFFFLLDGPVARGQAAQGITPENLARINEGKKPKGINPFLAAIHEGGDFFDLSRIGSYTKAVVSKKGGKGRQDEVKKTEMSLLDLASAQPNEKATIHYDAIGFLPITIIPRDGQEGQYDCEARFSTVPDLLDPAKMIDRLVATARLRGLL